MAQNFLSRAEFARTPAGQKPGATYEGYTSWVTNTRARRAAARAIPADPLAPTPEPMLRQQTSQAVHAQIDPILNEIMRSTDNAAAGVERATETHAARLAPFADAAKERFGRAAQGIAGVGEALAARLAGRGVEEAGGLKAKLAAIDAPGALVNELAGATAGFASGAANAGFASDSAALEELLSRKAGAEDFAGSLPGIARVAGVRSVGDVRAEGQRQVGEVRGKIPGLLENLMEGARDRELNKAIARTGLQTDAQKAKAAAEAARADAAEAADKSAQAWTRIQQTGDRLRLQAGNASFNQAVANAKLNLSQDQYRLALQKEARLSKAPGKKTGGFTAAQKQNMAGLAVDTAKGDFFGEVYDGKGNITGHDDKAKLTPLESMQLMIAKGIPFSIAVRAIQHFGKNPDASPEWKATLGWTK